MSERNTNYEALSATGLSGQQGGQPPAVGLLVLPQDGGPQAPDQLAQQTQQMGESQAATQQQEAIMRNQPGMAFPSQPGPSSQGGPMAGVGIPNLSELPVPLQQHFANPEVMKLSPEELKRRGLTDEIIQQVIGYRTQLMAKALLQGRKEQQEIQLQRQLEAQQQAENPQRETPQVGPSIRPSSGVIEGCSTPRINALPQPGGPQIPGAVPPLPGPNVPPELLAKAQEKVRATITHFHNKRDYTSVDLTREQGDLLEQSFHLTQSLLKLVAQNLVSFVILAPHDEQELNQVALAVVTLSDQAQLLQKQPPEKRFIIGLVELKIYRQILMTFLTRVKSLQAEAPALQNAQVGS